VIAIAEKSRLPGATLGLGDAETSRLHLLLVPAQPDHAGLQVDSSLVPSECCDACNFFHSP